MKQLTIPTKVYIAFTILAAAILLGTSASMWTPGEMLRFIIYLVGAILASNLKVTLPGITGTMSVNFVFVLIGVVDLNLPQVLAIGCAGTAGQVLFRAKSRAPVRLIFNLASATLSVWCCFFVYHSTWLRALNGSVPMLLFFSAAALFLVNTLSVAGVIALAEERNPWQVWNEGFLWTASHHLVGAGVAAVVHFENLYLGWEASVLTVPMVYFVYRSYSLHLSRLDVARKHAEELGDLHWRAIEALALAIDAKDETTHNHLLRVKVYATELSKELKLDPLEMQAVQAAALLHDIGKLAVPEYIIKKPGKLTREEFERMKIHPVIGAEILERVRFPYPVVPIVHSHHEKWNGMGYPEGLKGKQIPIGARILAAVDCLDALASDRQYRRAMPLDEAMAVVASESGVSFDPEIVAILQRSYRKWEGMATSIPSQEAPKLSRNVTSEAGGGPASGYAEAHETLSCVAQADALTFIADAQQEFRSLIGTIEGLGFSLSVEETMSILMGRLKSIVPHDVAAVFLRQGKVLVPIFKRGEHSQWLIQSEFGVGEGLTGWVVENGKPIVNGNPAVEPGYPERMDGGTLESAISIPLEIGSESGAITLYAAGVNVFTNDQLRILLGISAQAGMILANALTHQRLSGPGAETIAAALAGHRVQEVRVGLCLT